MKNFIPVYSINNLGKVEFKRVRKDLIVATTRVISEQLKNQMKNNLNFESDYAAEFDILISHSNNKLDIVKVQYSDSSADWIITNNYHFSRALDNDEDDEKRFNLEGNTEVIGSVTMTQLGIIKDELLKGSDDIIEILKKFNNID